MRLDMCGIAGQATRSGEPVEEELVRRMTAALRHRGPDGDGFYFDDRCGLGHRRLSLIDLATGGQPLANEDKSVWLVSNSEIYNYIELRAELQARGHVFRTAGDTEVILHLYEELGPQVVDRLVGMFAFGLWDVRLKTLFLARDRFGIKPLYYAVDGRGDLVFASEIKSLLIDKSIGTDLDHVSLQQYFLHLTIPEPATAFRGIRKVPPGHFLSWRDGTLTETSYWDLTAAPAAPHVAAENPTAVLDQSLAASVAMTLRSDVPVGVFLSGGIDSSLLTWYASQDRAAPLQTFSISFVEREFDEGPYSRLVAAHCRTDHHEFGVTMEEAADVLIHLASSLDEPFADASCIPTYILSREARRSVKAVLTGEGSDELFAGSGWHTDATDGQQFEQLLLPDAKSVFTPQALQALFSEDVRLAAAGGMRPHAPGLREKLARCAGPLERRLCVDLHEYLPSDLLMKTDRMTMLASLEARVPFLNHPFVQTAWALPSDLKLKDGVRKFALKQLARGRLPVEIISRPKKGFSIPMDAWLWMRGRFRDMVFDTLLAPRTRARGLFDVARIETMLHEHDRLKGLHGYRLWTLFVFELWHRHFVDEARPVIA